jgi:Metallo-peptidase family M12/IPT/TIG domain
MRTFCGISYWFAVSVLILAGAPMGATQSALLVAAAQGDVIEAQGTSARAEIVLFGEELVPSLLAVAESTTVLVASWPVAPDERADVLLSRFDVYASAARLYVVDGHGEREVPRSRLAFFSGTALDDPEMTVFAAVDPQSGQINGFTQTRDAFHELHPLSHVPSLSVAQGSKSHLVAPAEVFLEKRGEQASWACGQSGAPLSFLREMHAASERKDAASSFESVFAAAITTLHTATIAVDTDNELLSVKFGNNTTTATNYIASLIASMTVIYERDALVRLLQGTTYLRPSTTADPYNQATSGNASSAKLQEFSNVWNSTYAAVPRALAMMLSGKQPSGGASGIAWLTSLCSDYYGTSFSQVYTTGTTPSSGDILVVAHELGHNFGSPHTHCYSTPIDNCYNAESGCFAGTRSCPAAQTINGVTGVTGTLMSYCHLSGLAGCSSRTVFHPRTISERLGPSIQSATGGAAACIFPAATPPPPPVVSAVNPKTGSTAGGTAVTISGSAFQAGASVTFGGTAATSVVVVNATTITAVTPARSTGSVAVAVTNPGGLSSSLANGFFYAPPAPVTSYYTMAPCRAVDTRNANGASGGPVLAPSQVRTFPIASACSLPAGARSVVVNVTSVSPTASGSFGLFPGNAFPMGTSVLNFSAGQTRASFAILMLSTDGAGSLGVINGSAGSAHFVLDVTGYFQ